MNLRKVPVDLSMLPVALESHGETQWYLDLETGDVIPVFDDPEEEEKIENDPDRFLLIEPSPAHDNFRTMEQFVADLPAGESKRDLERVLRRAKPFRNFREALQDWPEIQRQWFALHEERSKAAAREWLTDNGIEPIPRMNQG